MMSSNALPQDVCYPYVIGGATATDKRERLRAAEALIRIGCDGILVWIPYTTDEEYEEQVREIVSPEAPPSLCCRIGTPRAWVCPFL